jgi:hypothetical protein
MKNSHLSILFLFILYLKKMSNFPPGWFFIQSKCPHKMVLDVHLDSLKVKNLKEKENFNDTNYRLKGSCKSGCLASKNKGCG